MTVAKVKDIQEKDLSKLYDLVTKKTTFLLLHADWCLHCQMFLPVWGRVIEQASREKISDHVQFINIESSVLGSLETKNPSLYDYLTKTNKSNKVYFPKLMVFKKSGERVHKSAYDNGRDEQSVYKYILSKLPKEVKDKMRADAKAAIQKAKDAKKKQKSKVDADIPEKKKEKKTKKTKQTKKEKSVKDTKVSVKKTVKTKKTSRKLADDDAAAMETSDMNMHDERQFVIDSSFVDDIRRVLGQRSHSLQSIINDVMKRNS